MDNLNFNLLKVFMCVATSNSFLEASKKLYISQPAISKSIKTLEDELNVSLFFRGNKGICLTPDGKTLLKYVKEAYNLLEIGERKIQEANSLNNGLLVIGVDAYTNKYTFNKVLDFKKKYSGIKIKVISADIEALENHEVDFLITINHEDIYDHNIKQVVVETLNTCFIKSKTYDSGSIILPTTNSILRRKLNIDIKPCLELDDKELVMDAVRNDLGIGFVIDQNISTEFIKTNLNYELPKIDINLIYMDNHLTKVAKLFIDEFVVKKDI